jgi:hypothetical protein
MIFASWPSYGTETVFDYSFSVWPDEQNQRNNKAVFALFEYLKTRIVMEFTEKQFNNFSEELSKVGLILHETERIPHLVPTKIYRK